MKYTTFISQKDMIKAKTNPKMLEDILLRIDKYLKYISEKAYSRYYKYNNSVSFDDVYQYIKSQIITSIKTYYNIKHYDKSKDKNNVYRNAFTYINLTCKYILNNIKVSNYSKKRYYYDKIIYIDSLEDKNTLERYIINHNSSTNNKYLIQLINEKITNLNPLYKNIIFNILNLKYKNYNELIQNLKEIEIKEFNSIIRLKK